jgi:predicted esterase YcpF (UPF0227 family)
MTIIYLHGMGNAISIKETLLKNEFHDEVILPRLPIDPISAEQIIHSVINETENLIFAGISLGGFWANYFAQVYNVPCVLINPMLNPSQIMHTPIAKRFGKLISKFIPSELIFALDGYLSDFATREKYVHSKFNKELVHLFLAKDDRIISYKTILSQLPGCATCVIKPNGGHSFDEHFGEVINTLRELNSQVDLN